MTQVMRLLNRAFTGIWECHEDFSRGFNNESAQMRHFRSWATILIGRLVNPAILWC